MGAKAVTHGLGMLALLNMAPAAYAVTASEQIQRLEQVYAALLDYRPGEPPVARPAGEWELGAELLPVPSIDNQVGAKHEPVSPPPLIPRGRLLLGLGGGFSLGVAYIPPIDVQRFEADLAGAELEYGLQGRAWLLGLRAFSLGGTVTGPISAPSSRDKFTVQNSGGDARLGLALGHWIVYAGGGSGQSQTRLTIASDGSVNRFTSSYGYYFEGLSWRGQRWRLTVEQQQTEDYLSHVVLTAMLVF